MIRKAILILLLICSVVSAQSGAIDEYAIVARKSGNKVPAGGLFSTLSAANVVSAGALSGTLSVNLGPGTVTMSTTIPSTTPKYIGTTTLDWTGTGKTSSNLASFIARCDSRMTVIDTTGTSHQGGIGGGSTSPGGSSGQLQINSSGSFGAATAGTDYIAPNYVELWHNGTKTTYSSLTSAISAAASGDHIRLHGTHDVGVGNVDGPTPPTYCTIEGDSWQATTITSSSNNTNHAALQLNTGLHLVNLSVTNTTGKSLRQNAGTTISNIRLDGVYTYGYGDAIQSSGATNVIIGLDVRNSFIFGGFDGMFMGAGGNTQAFYNTDIYMDAPLASGNQANCFRPTTTSVFLRSCKVRTTQEQQDGVCTGITCIGSGASTLDIQADFTTQNTNATSTSSAVVSAIIMNAASTAYIRPGTTFNTTAASGSVPLYDIDNSANSHNVYVYPGVKGSNADGTLKVNDPSNLINYVKLDPNLVPTPGASSLGGLKSASSTSHQFVTNIDTSGIQQKAQPADADLSITDVTTNNASTSAHGFLPKLPNDSTKFLNGVGSYAVPSYPTASSLSLVVGTNFNHVLTVTGVGTAYPLTGTITAAVTFGTTSPTLTLDATGKWLLLATTRFTADGSYEAGGSDTISVKIRRTNNTPANIGKTISYFIPGQGSANTFYQGADIIQETWSEVYSGTSGDVIVIAAGNPGTPAGGSITVTSTTTTLTAIYLGNF